MMPSCDIHTPKTVVFGCKMEISSYTIIASRASPWCSKHVTTRVCHIHIRRMWFLVVTDNEWFKEMARLGLCQFFSLNVVVTH